MLSSDNLLCDWKPVIELCAKTIAKLGSRAHIDAGDVASDVALVLISRDKLKPGCEIKEAFVIKIAQYCILAQLRRVKKNPLPLIDDVPDDADKGDSFEEDPFTELQTDRPRVREIERTARELRRDAIRQALRDRSPRDQAIVIRRYMEGKTTKAIAEALNVSHEVVRKVSSRFKQDARRLAELGPPC
jgi:RNA polymerase sigma factor (sigma-70 family)